MSQLFGEDWISLKYLKRYPNSERTKSWYGKIVAIQSNGAYWKAGGHGYTYRPNAAAYTFEDALSYSAHCGPEKHVYYHLHSVITDENHNFDPSGRRKPV